jgi:glycerophosphoryl diester phosphodiesterase
MIAAALGNCQTGSGPGDAREPVYFQSHRGGLDEMPENTMRAFRHSFAISGAVPEVDVRTTQDGVLIALHNATLAETTIAPALIMNRDVRTLTYEQVLLADAGLRYGPKFLDERVPRLTDLLELLREDRDRRLYLDLKDADFVAVKALLDAYACEPQILFANGSQEDCIALKKLFPQATTMTWCSGTPEQIKAKFERYADTGFAGLDQIQLHLKVVGADPEPIYALDAGYLQFAYDRAEAAGADLQLRPFAYTPASLRGLLDIGARWFVTDTPQDFAEAIADAWKL